MLCGQVHFITFLTLFNPYQTQLNHLQYFQSHSIPPNPVYALSLPARCMRRRLPLPQLNKAPKRIHGTYTYILIRFAYTTNGLSDFVLYYTFYVYIFSCLFFDPPMFALYMYVLRIRFTYTSFSSVYLSALYLYVLLIRSTYTLYVHFYLYVLLIRPILIRYTCTYYLYIILIRITYTLYLYI